MHLLPPLLALAMASGSADTARGRFYAGRDWGTESQFNPVSVVLNETWDISQLEDQSHSLEGLWAPTNFAHLNGALSHPFESIRHEGTGRFLSTEFFPTSLSRDRSQWMPNWQLHLLGGGMRNAELEEWYTFQGCEHPALAAAATTMLAGYLNEVSEISRTLDRRTADPISDVYVFDVGGILLFQSDAVKDFFAGTLRMANWPLQPTWRVGTSDERNAGQYWMVKPPIPGVDRWRLFYHVGLGNIGGITRDLEGGNDLTVAAGLYTHHGVNLDNGVQTVALRPKLGVFWDRENSLLMSVFWNSQSTDRFLVNVYPGVLPTGRWKLGLWMSSGGLRNFHAGVTGTTGLGVGI